MRWFRDLVTLVWFVFPLYAWGKQPPKHVIQYRTEDCKTNENARSCAWLGAFLEKKGKQQQAKKFYKKACKALIRPIGSACYLWGLLAKDKKIALQAFFLACKRKDPDGCTALGIHFARQGKLAKALPLFQKACAGKDGRGCHRFALHLIKTKKKKSGMRWMLKACKYGYPPGCGYLGWFYETKKKNKKKALLLYRYGCKLRGSVACARLGLFWLREGKKGLAKKHLSMSCKMGFQRACKRLKSIR